MAHARVARPQESRGGGGEGRAGVARQTVTGGSGGPLAASFLTQMQCLNSPCPQICALLSPTRHCSFCFLPSPFPAPLQCPVAHPHFMRITYMRRGKGGAADAVPPPLLPPPPGSCLPNPHLHSHARQRGSSRRCTHPCPPSPPFTPHLNVDHSHVRQRGSSRRCTHPCPPGPPLTPHLNANHSHARQRGSNRRCTQHQSVPPA